jgi:hypothetical protein
MLKIYDHLTYWNKMSIGDRFYKRFRSVMQISTLGIMLLARYLGKCEFDARLPAITIVDFQLASRIVASKWPSRVVGCDGRDFERGSIAGLTRDIGEVTRWSLLCLCCQGNEVMGGNSFQSALKTFLLFIWLPHKWDLWHLWSYGKYDILNRKLDWNFHFLSLKGA